MILFPTVDEVKASDELPPENLVSGGGDVGSMVC